MPSLWQQHFIKQCFKYEASERPTATQLLKDPYINNTQSNSEFTKLMNNGFTEGNGSAKKPDV